MFLEILWVSKGACTLALPIAKTCVVRTPLWELVADQTIMFQWRVHLTEKPTLMEQKFDTRHLCITFETFISDAGCRIQQKYVPLSPTSAAGRCQRNRQSSPACFGCSRSGNQNPYAGLATNFLGDFTRMYKSNIPKDPSKREDSKNPSLWTTLVSHISISLSGSSLTWQESNVDWARFCSTTLACNLVRWRAWLERPLEYWCESEVCCLIWEMDRLTLRGNKTVAHENNERYEALFQLCGHCQKCLSPLRQLNRKWYGPDWTSLQQQMSNINACLVGLICKESIDGVGISREHNNRIIQLFPTKSCVWRCICVGIWPEKSPGSSQNNDINLLNTLKVFHLLVHSTYCVRRSKCKVFGTILCRNKVPLLSFKFQNSVITTDCTLIKTIALQRYHTMCWTLLN